jgi:flagellar secretion chaperone FliS
MGNPRGVQAYYQTHVRSQTPLELVVLMYDGALRFMRLAADAIQRRDLVAKRDAMSRTLAILSELQNTLNMAQGGDIARSLDSLYRYISHLMIEANTSLDPAPVEEAIRLIQPLRDAWAQIALPRRASAPPRP